MYAVVLSYDRRPELRSIDAAHRYVLGRLVEALQPLAPNIAQHGTSDLALAAHTAHAPASKKFSGNSMRAKRRFMLYHGTLLYDFDLSLIERYLRHPPREPQYRAGRAHTEFIANLPIGGQQLRTAIARAFDASQPLTDWPRSARRNWRPANIQAPTGTGESKTALRRALPSDQPGIGHCLPSVCRCSVCSSAMPCLASLMSAANSFSLNVASSPVPCTSTKRPRPVITTFMSTSASTSSE